MPYFQREEVGSDSVVGSVAGSVTGVIKTMGGVPHDPDMRREDLPESEWGGHADHRAGTSIHTDARAGGRLKHMNATMDLDYMCEGGGPACVRKVKHFRKVVGEQQVVYGGPETRPGPAMGDDVGGGPPTGWATPVHDSYPEMSVADQMAKAPTYSLAPIIKDLPRRASATADERLKQLETETGVPIRVQWNSNAKAAKKVFNEQFPPDPNLPDNANSDEPGWRGVDGAGVARTPTATRTAATALIA